MRLINEEVTEVYEELFNRGRYDKAKVAKEIADLLYVVYGAADVLAIPIDAVFREVHRSNMSKNSVKTMESPSEDGKVLKGPNYIPANLELLSMHQFEEEEDGWTVWIRPPKIPSLL